MSNSKSKTTNKKTITKKNDIEINVIDHKPFDDSFCNYLVLSFKGNDINHVIMNTLRRVIMELVPIYAFDKKDIDIKINTSIYNNDYMRLRLSQFPVIGIENEFDTIKRSANLEYEANISTFETKIEDLSVLEAKEKEELTEKAENLTMYVNIKNIYDGSEKNADGVLSVTTDDEFVRFYYKGKQISSPYKQKLLIIKLKPGEEFNCTAVSTLNIGLKGANYMPNSVCTFSENENSTYNLNIESLKQLTEKEIIIRACAIIDIKLSNFLDIIINKINEYKSEISVDNYNLENVVEDNSSESDTITDSAIRNSSDEALEQHRIKGVIKIENESHTFGNLLSRLMQDHKSILFAGYKIDHLLVKELSIGYKTDGVDINNVITDIINKAKNIFKEISDNIEQLEI
jgi:DNA-directed RNA polymerase subunit L